MPPRTVHSDPPAETGPDASPVDDRPTWPAIFKGFRRTCPHCGKGRLFDGYLTVVDHCPVCREDMRPQRADDGPAYLTILVVGHIVAVGLHFVWGQFRPDPLVMATGFTIATVALALYLLPRLKGVIVAIQWSRRMHGFGTAP